MKTIDYYDLTFVNDEKKYPTSSFGKISKCSLEGKIYALKKFNNAKYLKGKKRKLSMLEKIQNNHLLTPKYWVKKENETNMYLCDYSDGIELFKIKEYSLFQKLTALKQAKEALLSMHKEKIIHSDISIYNIMIENDIAKIIDFDNCTYSKFTTNINSSNDYVIEFVKTYGIRPELDIHLFNILTLELINNWTFFSIKKHIFTEDYGFFNNPESKKICNKLFIDDNTPYKDFLIDTIDETNFTL